MTDRTTAFTPQNDFRHGWYNVYVCEWVGMPRTIPFRAGTGLPTVPTAPGINPAQTRAMFLVQLITSERDIARLELATQRALAGQIPATGPSEGWWNSAGAGIIVNADQIVSFGNQYDEMNGKYPDEAFEMPLADFLPLWRDWVASVRHYHRLLDQHGVDDGRGHRILPEHYRPACYPPPTEV